MKEIECIYCQTKYNINEEEIGNKKKRLRCAKCKEVFTYQKNENNDIVVEKEEKKAQDQKIAPKKEVDEIFDRLDKSLKTIEDTTPQKDIKKNNIIFYAFIIVVVLLLCLNYYRYDIVRSIPFLKNVYTTFGIKSTISGEGLEFSNVTKVEFDEDGVNHLRVEGYVINNTDKEIEMPKIIATLLNEDAFELQKEITTAKDYFVLPNDRIPFEVIIKKPSPVGKYVYLTFEE